VQYLAASLLVLVAHIESIEHEQSSGGDHISAVDHRRKGSTKERTEHEW
jgi:hypothetical protein